ncbi:TorF family putative porin [Acidovorax sp. NCPPB 4044]|uniref:TorF family putative porin n=1 Tax=Acidovorax sp. NCPPB 4044 TaxID=2940490 RepID=UPI00230495EF|nr:TorF family putative porin [Acidovorax sp. NCPPB 4044]MDA8523090.1 TorF family putative porin [Acidovorax sp. NCPPB 4044]
MNRALKSLCLGLLAATPLWASAQLTGNISLTSNYKFRGQDQDTSKVRAFKPAVQGGIDYSFGDSGFYLGNWNSTVDWLPGNSVEMDFYGGYKFKAGGMDLDVGALTYVYPGNTTGNTTELYGAATLGPVTAKYSHTVSKDYFGWAGAKTSGNRGRNTGYLNVAFAQEVAPNTTLKASVGFTRFASDIKDLGVPNYVDYSVGGAYDFGSGLSLTAAVTGANKKEFFGPVNKNRLIVTLTKTL